MTILDSINMDFYSSVSDDISRNPKPFNHDPMDGCYDAFELRRQRESEFSSDPKNPKQLPMIAEEGRGWLKTIERSIYEIGGLATIAKRILPHGEFQNWVKKEWGLSTETVNNFMNVYKVCFGQYELVHMFKHGSLLVEICRPRFPAMLRELILENGEPEATIKEVWEFAKGFKDGKYELDDPIVEKWYSYQDECSDYEWFKREKSKRLSELRDLVKTANNIPKGSEWPTFKNKVSCSKKESENLENLNQKLHILIDELFPDIEIIDDKQQFDMSKM